MPADVAVALGLMVLAAVALATGADLARHHLPRLWDSRCRYGLARHRPVKIITSARLLTVTPTGAAFAEMSAFHRCERCRERLNPTHPEIRPL